MTADLPIPAMSDDITDRIAKEVAALVSDHIEAMYPDAARAVAWSSAKRSIQGVVRNAVKSAGDAAEIGQADQWIKKSARNRREMKAMRKKVNWGYHD
ncbi:hypothetical protein [Oceaniglobus trochenteri]|uniref:hypothetical protein n=1 Tax=Oceaniglobus trochenteri TaxID=2763260 RepID=UPI001CFFB6A3|nr:hypothetical protein [Oceaniglobus trochenteri]